MYPERAVVGDDECLHSTQPIQIFVSFQELACFSGSVANRCPRITMNPKIAMFVNGVECCRPIFWIIFPESSQYSARFCLFLVENSNQSVEFCFSLPCEGGKRIFGWVWLFPTLTQHKNLIGQVHKMWLAKKFRIGCVRIFHFQQIFLQIRYFLGIFLSPCDKKLVHLFNSSWSIIRTTASRSIFRW